MREEKRKERKETKKRKKKKRDKVRGFLLSAVSTSLRVICTKKVEEKGDGNVKNTMRLDSNCQAFGKNAGQQASLDKF